MKTSKLLLWLALLVPMSLAWAQKIDPNKLPEVPRSDFKWSEGFLSKYPMAPAACLQGRVDKGVKYGKFDAKVYVTNLPNFVTFTLLDVAGNEIPSATFSVKPKPGAVVYINGKKVNPEDLNVGEKVTFWVPENKLDARQLEAPTAQSWRVISPATK
jgi:hypothetical protein